MTAKKYQNMGIAGTCDNHITKVLTNIKGAIQDLPLSTLTDVIRKEIGQEDGITAAVLAHMDASEAIDRLETECLLANQSAISELLELGIRISNILAHLLGDPNDGPVIPNHLDTEEAAEPEKVIAIIRDEIRQLLECDPEILHDNLNREIQEPKKLRPIYHPAHLTEITGLLGDEEDVEDGLLNPTSLTTALFQHAVGRRMAQESQLAAWRVATNSINWPVSISCFAEIREAQHNDYFSKLPVGNGLEFQTPIRIAGRRGRDFNRATSTGFTKPIFMQLRKTREKALRMNNTHLEWYREIELATTKGRRDQKKTISDEPSIPNPNDYTGRESLDDRWERMAILLPEFSEETLKTWVNAATAYCEAKCQGDWKLFKRIAWVRTRMEAKQQSVETCLRERLKAGLTTLLKSP